MRRAPSVTLVLPAVVLACSRPAPRVEPARTPDGRILLIVRGDDFGSTHASNAALGEAFTEGIMTSASVIVAGPWFRDAAAQIREHPEWSVGVHLTITSEFDRLRWGPILPAGEVSSLVAPDGAFFGGGYHVQDPGLSDKHRPFWAPGPPDPDQVERELRAQIRFAQELGVRVDYLDCHMGMACRELLPIVRRIAGELCLPVPEQGLLGEREVNLEDSGHSRREGKEAVLAMLRSLTPGVWRYIGHPAHDTPELRAVDSEWGARIAAIRSTTHQLWRDPDVKRLVARRSIELVSVADLWDYERCEPRIPLTAGARSPGR
jgi:hypothetical protein